MTLRARNGWPPGRNPPKFGFFPGENMCFSKAHKFTRETGVEAPMSTAVIFKGKEGLRVRGKGYDTEGANPVVSSILPCERDALWVSRFAFSTWQFLLA